jgi:enoyl-CoA hydratase/carnithine racemase
MSSDPVLLDIRDRIAYVTLNRPEAMNAIDEGVLEALWAHVTRLAEDDSVRALVVTGAGDAFCIGLDIGLLDDAFADSEYFRSVLVRFRRLLLGFEALPFPVISAVNGRARAGGFEIILASDLVLIADEAKIADHHLAFGIMPGGGATQRAPRKLGDQRARELIFTARWIDGKEAERIGVALRSVPRASLDGAVEELAAALRPLSRQCLGATKGAMREGALLPLDEALDLEIDHFIRYLNTVPSSREGYLAFKEKRDPVWP